MKSRFSLFAFFTILIISISIRIYDINKQWQHRQFCLTTFDALGYYMYLPAGLIYDDVLKVNWLQAIDVKYGVVGSWQYQTIKEKNGNFVFKYLGGVAIMELPFFLMGHAVAKSAGFEADGFSLPYQYALVVAAFFYAFIGLYYLRRFLLDYFDDKIVAITLLLLTIASNWVQYVAIDSAQSHVYIFPLYVWILFGTRAWHQKPTLNGAFLIGFIIGLATICRPTEGIMLFIPLLWNTQTKENAAAKWALVKQYKPHVWAAIIGGFLAISPQLIYWKYASGHFLYDVGSKWYFLNPYFRVIFGFEKGWFVYTPVAILFVLGLFFIKKFPFRKSVITLCLLNMYIIIAWADWKYGGSYSCRALVQSYAIFALPLAAIIQNIVATRWRTLFYALCFYLISVNIFQIYQYNKGILRYDENSFEYYKSIYLNPNAPPFQR